MTSKAKWALMTGIAGAEIIVICLLSSWILQPVPGDGSINIAEIDPGPGYEYRPLAWIGLVFLAISIVLGISCLMHRVCARHLRRT